MNYINETQKSFFDMDLFKAKNLMTSDGLIKLDINSTPEQITSVLKSANKNDIKNIIISNNDKCMGYISIDKLDEQKQISKRYIIDLDKYKIDKDDNLNIIIKKFAKDVKHIKGNEYPLYFVMDGDNCIGVMTFWDLNRRSVYTYNYHIISFIELQIKKYLIDNCNTKLGMNWINKSNHMNKRTKTKVRDFYDTLNINKLNKWNLSDLISVYFDDPHIKNIRGFIKNNLVNDLYSLRNNIMHPVELILPKENAKNWKNRLKLLENIMTDGQELVINYDKNPKNRDTGPIK